MRYLPITSSITYLLGSIVLFITAIVSFDDVPLPIGILNVVGITLFVAGSITSTIVEINNFSKDAS